MHDREMRRIGWGLTVLFALFMSFDTVIKLIHLPVVEETLTGLGYPPGLGFPVGVMEAVVLVLFVVPRTAALGAILNTALFGGAIASNLRAEQPLATHVLFGLYLGVLCWGGLWLREPRLRGILPLRR